MLSGTLRRRRVRREKDEVMVMSSGYLPLHAVPRQLEGAPIVPWSPWLYTMDANVERVDCPRINRELGDIKWIADQGAGVAILAHKGRSGGLTPPLDFLGVHLSMKLGRDVECMMSWSEYWPDAVASMLRPGRILVLGNARAHPGEEAQDPAFTAQLGRIAANVAIGGFSKSHREAASTTGILEHCQGWLTSSHRAEMALLDRWRLHPGTGSVAVLGGLKAEKWNALPWLLAQGFSIIPGGLPLNLLLEAKYGGDVVGGSLLREGPRSCEGFEGTAASLLEKHRGQILLPETVFAGQRLADGSHRIRSIVDLAAGEKVPKDLRILGFRWNWRMDEAVALAAQDGGRLLLAGSPEAPVEGPGSATRRVQQWLERFGSQRALILGGDTAEEFSGGAVCTGGGAALRYLQEGTTAVLEKLIINAATSW